MRLSRLQILGNTASRPAAATLPDLPACTLRLPRGGEDGLARLVPGALEPDERATARRLVVALAKALHTAGVPAPELESAVRRLSRGLGLEGVALASPTSLFLSFQGAGAPELHLERVEPGDIDLGRLVSLEELARSVEARELCPSEALERLEALLAAPGPYRPHWSVVAFALAAGSAAVLFQAGTGDALAAAALGGAVGLLALFAQRRELQLLEPLAALASTLGAAGLASAGLVQDAEAVALAALIVLVPGYSSTVALSELAHRHLTSGTTRLFGAFGSFLGLGLGVGLGRVLAVRLFGEPLPAAPTPAGPLALGLALLATPLAFGVLFRVRARHFAWVALGGLVAYAGARLGTWSIGPELGAGAGALAVGLVSNWISRGTGLPAALALVPGILLLVPGSIGFRSVAQFLQHDPLTGLDSAFRMAFVAMALVGGLLASHSLFPPRRIV